ncbi:MAG: hypothetical protein LZF63_12240 [Nitrosomonas sp.]|nr:hypothetical protein [Nitrosomonas sp.]
MKKLLLGLSLLVMSSSCFAIVNFTSSNGALVMRDVSVDGTTLYDSVTLKLDLATGTFTILDATLADNSFSATPLDTLTQNGIKTDFMGCKLSGKNQITCMTKVVSLTKDRLIIIGQFGSGGGTIFDNQSKEYISSTVTALDKSGGVLDFNAIQGIPIEVKFIFNDIDPAATSISSFQPMINGTELDFRDIHF